MSMKTGHDGSETLNIFISLLIFFWSLFLFSLYLPYLGRIRRGLGGARSCMWSITPQKNLLSESCQISGGVYTFDNYFPLPSYMMITDLIDLSTEGLEYNGEWV